jgi:signal transduction histidine kinase
MAAILETQAVLDALGHGVLIFSADGKLVQHNLMAGTILGTDLNIIRSDGWAVASELFDTGLQAVDLRLNAVKEQALKSDRPIRFRIYRSGAFIPCWAAPVTASNGSVYMMITLDIPDWELVSNVIDRFRNEMRDAIESTAGHIRLISNTLNQKDADEATVKIARRVNGFTKLIDIHMARAGRLISLLDRLQDIRTARIRDKIRDTRSKIRLNDFIEDFLEGLEDISLLDPESERHDYRARIRTEIEPALVGMASSFYLNSALQEILRNAIMYSLVGTPITLKVFTKASYIQIDVVDEGYGVRQKESERVFEPFSRARQPQIISEFGYGVALYLCKHEIEAMNGRLWFTSEENVGSTFSIWIPVWKDAEPSASSTQIT